MRSATKPALKIKDGQTVKIDTVNSTELNKDDYLAVLKSGGIAPTTPFIKETVAILSAPPPAELTQRSGRVGRLLTGPIYVEGAEPGDTLEVRVIDLAVQSDFAINRTITNMGHPLATMTPAPTARVYKLDRKKQKSAVRARTSRFRSGRISAKWASRPRRRWAPIVANRPTRTTGGALDCPDLGKGASIYFPVHVPGAMFMAGGGKATGANGKVNYFGMEVPLTAYLQFVVHKGKARPAVRAENATHYITFGTADMLDVVMRLSSQELVDFLKEKAEPRLLLRVLARVARHRLQHHARQHHGPAHAHDHPEVHFPQGDHGVLVQGRARAEVLPAGQLLRSAEGRRSSRWRTTENRKAPS